MVVSIKEKSREIDTVKNAQQSGRDVPGYLSVEDSGFAGKMLAAPIPEQISFPLTINVPMICEFLAHTT
jgi:small subunit ribosomal protein S4